MSRLVFLGALVVAAWYVFFKNTGGGDPRGLFGHQVGRRDNLNAFGQ